MRVASKEFGDTVVVTDSVVEGRVHVMVRTNDDLNSGGLATLDQKELKELIDGLKVFVIE